MNKLLEEVQWSVVCRDNAREPRVEDIQNSRWASILLYGTETWPTTESQENRLEVNEMRMLRWMRAVTKTSETNIREDEYK